MQDKNSLHVAVFGAGAFGRNHLRIYRQLQDQGVLLAAAVDTNPSTAEALRQEGLTVFPSAEACLQAYRSGEIHLDAVSVCVPTSAHFSVASQALAQGLDVLLSPLQRSLHCLLDVRRCWSFAGTLWPSIIKQ